MAEVARGSRYTREQSEGRHVGVEARHLLGGEVEVVHAELARLAQDVVVDVGDVAHQPGLVPEVAQPSLQDVEGQVHLGVPDVGGVIGRDAARVHRDDGPGVEGDDLAPRGCRRAASSVAPSLRSHVLEAGEAERAVRLVADVQGDEHGGEGLDGAPPGPGSRRRGGAARRSDATSAMVARGGLGVVRAHEHVGIEHGVEVFEVRGRQVVAGARPPWRRAARPGGRRPSTPGAGRARASPGPV